ncbi:hypothetical protein FXF51_42720 [Nonomuraea sp. PA05]|uniref:hypothetical protein n=1 Tax=Nonomuraea sp. PA05 TaxID=2604466 RepID=UPI0011D6DD13|nr:hypothetical protein [Nonomuraea sp. PA05]TYB56823.1 hypothetical protein FXF51_42720 [Nonomuraea sp. PA05]
MVKVLVGQVEPYPPVVRIVRLYEDSRGQRTQDFAPELATEVADILEALPGRTRELIAALRTSAETFR